VLRKSGLLVVYTLTIFTSATLLFLIQPLFTRMALPLLGGTPAVWNTAIVFYQAALLAGYIYAHAATTWLGVRRQALLHLILLLLPFLVLPIAVPRGWTPPTQQNPIPWLLSLLLVAVGLPFFVVSASSPMIQKWFANTGHPSAADPYFLYAASNLGSILALLSYPVLVEPYLRLDTQSRLWAVGYGMLVLLTCASALFLWRTSADTVQPVSPEPARAVDDSTGSTPLAGGLTVGTRLRWVLLSFIPSSLMLSVTTYLSTDIASIPLFWVVPLAIYLLTFVLVFARKPLLPHALMVRALPILLVPLVLALAARADQPILVLIPLHLVTFFVVAMVCHGQLAQNRPPTRHLTEFYLWMSVGGVLGGVLNALIAPLIFVTVVEYPLTLVLAALAARWPDSVRRPARRFHPLRVRSTYRPSSIESLVRALAIGSAVAVPAFTLIVAMRITDAAPSSLGLGLVFGLPLLLSFGFSTQPIRMGIGIGAVLLAGALYVGTQGRSLYTERSFFGIHRVAIDPTRQFHQLIHGTTLHGMQSLDPTRRNEPLTYYFRDGPIAQLFAAFDGPDAKQSVAVVGLGTGTLACYSKPGQRWTFYEIDPIVERIARDPRYFTFLQDCLPDGSVVLGDARLSLAAAPDQDYGMIILDAYSSDAIPVHLMTREALQLYLDKLAADGLLVFHISNRHLTLEPVLANLARDAGLPCRIQLNTVNNQAEQEQGKTASQWVLIARREADFGKLAADSRWQTCRERPGAEVWTDNFSSILSVFNWQ